MVWTAPMTAVSGQIFTASQHNTHIRDNFLEMGVAKATTAGQVFSVTGANSVSAFSAGGQVIDTSETRNVGTYGDLATIGPTVTLDTGTSALVFISCRIQNDSADVSARVSVEVTGASAISPDLENGILLDGLPIGQSIRAGNLIRFNTLTPGTNTFTMKYMASGASVASFENRRLAVLPL